MDNVSCIQTTDEKDEPPPSSWKEQLRTSITTLAQLQKIVALAEEEIKGLEHHSALPFRITSHYAKLLDKEWARKCVIPSMQELELSKGESLDPLGEEKDSKTSCIVHRYPDRVLFLATHQCSTYCRYCTRSRKVGHSNELTTEEWSKAFDYIKSHTEVRDVLISGGDPLTLDDSKIEFLLQNIRSIEHVEIIRIGTKVPVTLPTRITDSLLEILKKYDPLYVNIHFTHPDELQKETKEACLKLANSGIPLGSQTVVLKDINDDVDTMKSLYQGLLKIKVRPYYLYSCDKVRGASQFIAPISKGLEIIKGIRGFTSGLAVPHFVIDLPEGGGKTPLLPEYLVSIKDTIFTLQNYKNEYFEYIDTP